MDMTKPTPQEAYNQLSHNLDSKNMQALSVLWGEVERLAEIKEAAIDVSLTHDGIFEFKNGVFNSRESTLAALNEALNK